MVKKRNSKKELVSKAELFESLLKASKKMASSRFKGYTSEIEDCEIELLEKILVLQKTIPLTQITYNYYVKSLYRKAIDVYRKFHSKSRIKTLDLTYTQSYSQEDVIYKLYYEKFFSDFYEQLTDLDKNLIKYLIRGFTYKEIEKELSIPEATIKTLVFRRRKIWNQYLNNYEKN